MRGVLDALAKKPIDDDGALVGRELMQAKVRAASRTTGATVAPAPVIDERGVVHQPPAATRGTRGRP